ncbi:CPBP family intramembrane glutamic endopeptidase [Haloferula chungangensis]|uniref:CPBP family intramembrane glutamic endopeptidase n=1 Tax=Haloferula chungangensis TaxID=1048331 RepID=A0ABW2L885_9BACT
MHSDVLKIFLYVAASLALGAVISPWLYNLGMGLAEVTEGKDTNGVIHWLATHARNAEDNFPRYFDRALLLAAVVLLFPLRSWLRVGREAGRFRDTPWSLRLPDSAVVMDRGQPLRRNPRGVIQGLMGFLLAAGLLLVSGWLMIQAGMFMWRDAATSTSGVPNPVVLDIHWSKALRKAVSAAFVVATIEEVFFRGILLGIFLRAMKPAAAIVALSFLFAFVHFLEPPIGAKVPDPEAVNAGFVLLGQIFSRFADPMTVISRFMVLAAGGVVLAMARWRTASLWLPIGLHAGWVFSYAIFKSATWPTADLPEMARWLVGVSLLEGLFPLMIMVITGFLVAFLTRSSDEAERA